MPRVVPKTREYAAHVNEQANLRDASYEYARRKDEALSSVQQRFGFPSVGRSENGPYGEGTNRSYFLDLMYAAGEPRKLPIPPPIVGSPQEAQQRMQSVQGREYRDLTTVSTDGGGFVPTGSPPSYVADAFAASARAASVMSGVLPYRPLPASGMELKSPRITTSATVAAVVRPRRSRGGRCCARRRAWACARRRL
jgi:hypothetical protein